jgi:pimeloyl-ACP methyl ester carboxylesterase
MRRALPLVLAAACLVGSARAGDDAPKGEDVSFKTADGLTIAATYWPPATASNEPAPVVVALPMYKSERGAYRPMVGPITERGMGLLALDLRGHGGSAKQGDADLSKQVEARDAALFNAMHADVEAAVAWLAKEKKTPKGKVGLLGASVGCSVAIDAAVRNPDEFGAVVCLTPGKNYLGVPTMEHVEKWPSGKPLLLVSSMPEASAGADAIKSKLEGKGAEVKIVSAENSDAVKGPMDLHGTNMFGRVAIVEKNVADWFAYRLTMPRFDLGDGLTAVIGVLGAELYVFVETPAGFTGTLENFVLRIGTGDVTDPWSKSQIVNVGKRPEFQSAANPARRRTKFRRDALGVEPGRPFAVAVSLDGKRFLPEAGAPPLLITLK